MIKYVYIALAVTGVFTAAFIAGRNSTRKERSEQQANLIAARDSIETYSVKIAGLRTYVSEKDAIILTQKDAIAAGIIERERLRKLHFAELVANAELAGTIDILRDSLKIPPEIQIVTVKDTIEGNYQALRIPWEWPYESEYVKLAFGIHANKKGYFNLSVPFSGTISIGYVKSGFFKTTPKGVFTTDNPYLKVKQMDILIVEDRKKWYEKWWLHVLVGAATAEAVHQYLK